MKNYASMVLLTLSSLSMATFFTPANADLKAATYNITHGKKNNWLKRQPGVCNLIKQINADVYGLQEVIKDNNQFNAIKQALPDYAFVGQPRSSGIKGLSIWHRLTMLGGAQDEYNPIFYNQNKLELVASETFGINGNNWFSTFLPRICTFALLKNIASGKEFYVYNTHLDHKNEDDRIMQIKLIVNDIKQRCGATPVILMGDFNTTFVADMKKNLSDANFTQGRVIAKEGSGVITTHEKGKPFEIDHILVRPKDAFNVKLYTIAGPRNDTTSDHNPVCMTFTLN